MHRSALVAAGILLARLPSAALAEPVAYPQDGAIGIYADAAGTNCCLTIPPSTAVTLHVIATTAGASSAGITAAEFRVEVSPPAPGAFFVWSSSPAANVTLGNPIDNTDAPSDLTGVDIAFPTCQRQAGLAGDRILLGTIMAFGIGGEHSLLVKRHNRPSNPNLPAPLLILCDKPQFTAVPLTLLEGHPVLHGSEPCIFRSPINSIACAGGTCGSVGVAERTWSGMKALYR